MFQDLNIRISRDVRVYGRLNGSLKHPLIVIVHGLPGGIGEAFYEKAAEWFEKHGYAVYRFCLYGWQKDARQLIDCTLRTHADDVDAVARYFRRHGVQKMYLVGHSFGGPTILLSKEQRFDATVLWDPSHGLTFLRESFGTPGGKYVKVLNGYLMRWGASVVLGKAMVQEVERLLWDDLPKDFHVPLKIISAGKGVLLRGAKKYIQAAHEPKSLNVIRGATHYFDDTPGMQERVYRLSKDWFRRF